MSAALQLQHDAGLILSNMQVLGQFSQQDVIRSHARGVRAQTVPDGSSTVYCAVPPSTTGGALHGCHGIVMYTVYTGDTWTSIIVFMQRVHDVFGLFSRPSEVVMTETGGQ